MSDPWKAGFARFLDAVAPYLDEIVVAGGWASRLHRLSPDATTPPFEPLLTDDVDAALRPKVSIDAPRLDELLKSQGFEETLSTDLKPPVTRYELPEPEGFEVEFLTDQPGAYVRRDGTRDMTVAIAGVTAQKLHYVGLLLVGPWSVHVRAADGYPMSATARRVRIPNPVSYVVQKLLSRPHRADDKRVKDVLYVHDTLDLFGDAEDVLRREWLSLSPKVVSTWKQRCRASATQLASASHPDVIGALKLAHSVGRRSSAEAIASVLRVGLGFLFEDA